MNLRPAVVALVALTTCRGAARTRAAVGDLEVLRVTNEAATRLTAGGTARAAVRGDWILRDRALRVTVVGTQGPTRNEPAGTLAQIALRDAPGLEAVRTLEPLLRVGDRDLTLRTPRFEAVLEDGLAMLRVSGEVSFDGRALAVVRDLWLETGRRALHVRTRIRNVGPGTVRELRWGARLEWGGDSPFAPGLGVVNDARDGVAPWVGHAIPGAAVAWTSLTGSRDLELRFTVDQHGNSAQSSHTDALSHAHDLEPGRELDEHAMLLVTQGDLTDVARAVAFAREEPIGEASLVLQGNAREPTVTVTDAQGTPMLVAHPTGPTHRLPLPPGDYIAHATAPGHAPADPVRFSVTRESAGAVPVEVSIPRGGHLRVEATDEDTGEPLPVRITLRGIHPTRDPDLGPHDRAAGAGMVAVTTLGRTEVPVAPGSYHVTVSHGPEWTLGEQNVTVTDTLRGDVRVTLRHAVPMAAWTACDLHVHANPSFDSRVSIEDRVATLVAEGVGFATPTEHNVVGDYSAGVAILPEALRSGFQWVPAVEVTTDRSAQPWGHFNVYPYRPDPTAPGGAPPPFLNTPPRQIFRAARANNPDAIIQVNHPRMQPNIGYFNVTGLDPRTNRAVSRDYDPGFDAIEVFNGFYLGAVPQVEALLHDWMALLSSGARYVGTGSSDSHHVVFQWAGYPRTYVRAPMGSDTATVLRALRQGRAFVSSGPMLFLTVNGSEPGDTVAAPPDGAVTVRVRVQAAPWIPVESVDLYRDGQRVMTWSVPASERLDRLDATVSLPVTPGSHLLATARGPRGALNVVMPYSEGTPYAFTNPVWVGTTPRDR